jgi:large subunit ribosomal protein L1
MPKLSKAMKAMAEKNSKGKVPLDLREAVSILKSFPTRKFDQSVEIHMNLGVDPAQADQIVRGSVVLPHGIGKTQRILVFAKGDLASVAEAAGADFVGQEDLAKKIKDGWTDFDVCIATPDMMGVVGPLGKVLGPRGLMPAPRSGTVTTDVAKVIKEYKAGKVEFRNDKGANIHAIVGKLSFDSDQLIENVQAFINYVNSIKPNAVKGNYIKTIALCATMSPSVRVAA